MRVGVIGHGTIGAALVELIQGTPETAHLNLRVLVRAGRAARVPTVHSIEALGADPALDLVIEAAGHSAVASYGPAVLEAGCDLMIASLGALADADLHSRLVCAAISGGARLILPAGALGGLDLLASLQSSGIEAVHYEGRKPSQAWRGTPAEAAVDLENLTDEAIVFEGTAREAARSFPKNANVAAALALAGIGFDRTQARLIADPAAPGNVHSYTVSAGAAHYAMTITGQAASGTARTSATTVLSLYREVRNRLGPVAM